MIKFTKSQQNAIDKYIKEGKKLEEFLRSKGDFRFEHDEKSINSLPKDLQDWFIKWVESRNQQYLEWKTFIINNPEIPMKDRATEYLKVSKFIKEGVLTPEETIKHYESSVKHAQILKFLIENKDKITKDDLHDLPDKFFKTVENDEIGISRLMADPYNNLPKMLEKFNEPECIKDDIYLIKAEHENSLGDTIQLEYRFRASDQQEANRQAQAFTQRLSGRQKKVYEACWAMVNDKMTRLVTCELTDLMILTHPTRKKENLRSEEKFDFFQDLLDLAQTQLIVLKKEQPKRRKDKIDKFLLPFITIHKTSDYNPTSEKTNERYPNSVSFSVLHNPLYEREKLYNLGAGIKRKTLELHNDDMQLAEYLQIRKSQKMKDKFITFTERGELFKLAHLEGIKHSGMANKKLIQKFERLKEKNIILDYPKIVKFPFHIKIR